ncbi:MAG: hypothetical protein ACP5FL_05730 [Thermoplasmatota archaeon]
MDVQEEIHHVKARDEFRVCPKCGYQAGFHVSFLRNEKGYDYKDYRIILICPGCGARFDINWKLTLS